MIDPDIAEILDTAGRMAPTHLLILGYTQSEPFLLGTENLSVEAATILLKACLSRLHVLSVPPGTTLH